MNKKRVSPDSSSPSDDAPKPLGRQVSWTLPANIAYGLCSLLLLVVLNKWGSEAIAGRFSLALAIAGPLYLFAGMRFNTVLASDRRPTVWLSDYFSLRFTLLAICFLGVLGLLLTGRHQGIAALLVVVALAKSVEAISDLCCGVQQRIEKMDRIAISMLSHGALMFALFAGAYYFTRNLVWAAIGLLVGRLAVLLVYDLPMARNASSAKVFRSETNTRLNVFGHRKSLFLSALPLGFTSSLIALTSNIPCYLIPIYFDEKMLGLFASVAIVRQAGSLVFRAVEQPAVPRLAATLESNDRKRFWRVLLSISAAFVGIGIVGAIVSLAIGGQVLAWMFTPEYRDLGGVLALMMVANAIGQVTGMVESSLIAARVIRIQVPMHCLTTALCFVLSLWLIPSYGLYGAVIAMSVCRLPFLVFGTWLLHRKISEAKSVDESQPEPPRMAA